VFFWLSFSAADAPKGGLHLTLLDIINSGPTAKTASKPYLKCLDAGLPTLSFLHNFYLVHPFSLNVNQQHSIPKLHVLILLQPYEKAMPRPKLQENVVQVTQSVGNPRISVQQPQAI
jgi:hypothetical protein